MGSSYLDKALDTADHARKSHYWEAGNMIPGVNIATEGASAEVDSLMMTRDLVNGDLGSAASHGLGAAYHGAMSAMNFLTAGEAGVEVGELRELLDVGEGEHSLVDAARGKKEDYSYVDAARAGMHHDALNAVGGHH